jgi:dTDP-4-dehydrorhamnose reductase
MDEMDEFEAELEAYRAQSRLTLEEIKLETDELGIWLLVGDKQAGHVSWYEFTRHIQQQLLQEKFLLVLAKLDEEDGLL